MRKFAFIVSPLTVRQLKSVWPLLKILPSPLDKPFINNARPFKIFHYRKISSTHGKSVEGYLIACPLLFGEDLSLNDSSAVDKIIAACSFAQNLGADIIGLDGYASLIADKKYDVFSKNLKIPVTSGIPLTAWSVFEAVYKVAKSRKMNPKDITLSVIGASHAPGTLCAIKLSEQVGTLVISGKNIDVLRNMKEAIGLINSCKVIIEEDAHSAVKQADFVVNAGRAARTAFDMSNIKPGAVIIDIALSPYLGAGAKLRKDTSVIEAGLIKVPFTEELKSDFGLPKGVIHAPMAEAILLAFEGKVVEHSLGDQINPDKIEAIADISARHGFEVWLPEAQV